MQCYYKDNQWLITQWGIMVHCGDGIYSGFGEFTSTKLADDIKYTNFDEYVEKCKTIIDSVDQMQVLRDLGERAGFNSDQEYREYHDRKRTT